MGGRVYFQSQRPWVQLTTTHPLPVPKLPEKMGSPRRVPDDSEVDETAPLLQERITQSYTVRTSPSSTMVSPECSLTIEQNFTGRNYTRRCYTGQTLPEAGRGYGGQIHLWYSLCATYRYSLISISLIKHIMLTLTKACLSRRRTPCWWWQPMERLRPSSMTSRPVAGWFPATR
jgi:hypothetical protein